MKIRARIAIAATSLTTIAIIESILRRVRDDAGEEPESGESAAGFESIVLGMAAMAAQFRVPGEGFHVLVEGRDRGWRSAGSCWN
nr:hypothetical protein Itr_chr09CG09850 [Ipomoea trifida]GLL44097.1 hypothetical protein Itr_chr13CG06870 [Ipomoea trifida]GLL46248.1 hypothetical protein Itr_chr14CG08900 [Ipomoea trifida]